MSVKLYNVVLISAKYKHVAIQYLRLVLPFRNVIIIIQGNVDVWFLEQSI